MRSIGLLAVVTGTAMFASGCSDGAGTPPGENAGPEANFAMPACVINLPCGFTSSSSDDAGVTKWSWDFNGDNVEDAKTAAASFQYPAAGQYNVSLTVWDAEGLNDTKTSTLTLSETPNAPPVADFTSSCTGVDCSFTSTSTDLAPGSIVTYNWNFGDGATSDLANPSHSYLVTAATDFTVALTVTDNDGASATKSQTVSVTPPANTPPTAGFTHTCNAASCSFTSTSTDAAPGTIVTYNWTFGDLGTADVANPVHNYAITLPGTFTVTLTVTDNQGATDSETQTISVSPPVAGAEGCVTSGRLVNCALNVPAASTMKVKLLAVDCDKSLEDEKLVTPPPIKDQVFLHVCWRQPGKEIGIYGGPLDELIVYEAGSQVLLRFVQGLPDPIHPPLGLPAGRVEGTFPDWTLSFDDGSDPTGSGEPDMNDLVVGVHATLK